VRRDDSDSFDVLPDDASIADMCADADLRDAFLHDAATCLAAIEQAILELETNPTSAENRRQICRQLHTLKGASASVGLSKLSKYLHEVEESIERSCNDGELFDADELLRAVDAVRGHVGALDPSAAAVPISTAAPTNESLLESVSAAFEDGSVAGSAEGESQASVRVRTSKLDRLTDMLAELVVLRNRRETQFSELQSLNQELVHCASRLKQFAEQYGECPLSLSIGDGRGGNGAPAGDAMISAVQGRGFRATSKGIAEVANDLSEIARGLKDFYRPIGEENVALTHFIRHFRQEMMQLRRLPVVGLLKRLQRTARDAARSESKQVDVSFIGQQTAVEQSLQESLYEPLMHIVRNAVSHGIEPAAQRTAGGKPAAGKITLQVTSSANLLEIRVSDDGRGLDFDAIRRRGYERGLLSADRTPTRNELAKLIFHPGFSTRESATEVSGRGVGMDIVATAMDRLHGRIEIESSPARGTTIRLSLPLRSGIEHAMVFRCAGQLFAIPMHSVSAAQDSPIHGDPTASANGASSSVAPIAFARMAELSERMACAEGRVLLLDVDSGNRGPTARLKLIVDEIVGGEEVVVRALPRALKQHPFAVGVTLSGGGEMVLTIDPIRLWEHCRGMVSEISAGDPPAPLAATLRESAKRILVVDDSLSARRNLVKRLSHRGLAISEACDGLEALDCLRAGSYQLVITDIDMPRLGGLELLNEIRQRRLNDMPVVVVSSRTEADVRQRATRYGAQAFLHKPVSDEALAGLLQQFNLTAP
jgi:chemotaxis protein histidine kinase CheA/CheY-like chemotaxis protein